MTGDSDCFIKLTQINGGKVSFGGNCKGRIVGCGTVNIGSLTINNVSLVESLNYNLLNISQLCDTGFKINFQEDICSRTSKDLSQSFTGRRHGNIYLLDIKPKSSQCLISIQDEEKLWHRKLGHVNMKQIANISFKKLVRGLPNLSYQKSESCTPCVLEKHVRSSLKPINQISTNRVLQLLHMNLFGPTITQSIGGKKYYLVIVDDYSCFTWVFFLASKSEAFSHFLKFAKKVQNEKGYVISSI